MTFDETTKLIWAGVEHMMIVDENGACHNGEQLMHALMRNAARLAVALSVPQNALKDFAGHHHGHMAKAHQAYQEHGAENEKKPIIHIVKG
jgi:hypothetical protein